MTISMLPEHRVRSPLQRSIYIFLYQFYSIHKIPFYLQYFILLYSHLTIRIFSGQFFFFLLFLLRIRGKLQGNRQIFLIYKRKKCVTLCV